jgi:hypothetical protein
MSSEYVEEAIMSLKDVYLAKYGAGVEKTAAGFAGLSPAAKAKVEANKGNPGAAPGGKAPAKGPEKKASADAIFDYKMGKTASAAFMDELRKLNAADAMLLERAEVEESPLMKKLRAIA